MVTLHQDIVRLLVFMSYYHGDDPAVAIQREKVKLVCAARCTNCHICKKEIVTLIQTPWGFDYLTRVRQLRIRSDLIYFHPASSSMTMDE